MKSRVSYPKKPFAALGDAQALVIRLVACYNEEHRHGARNRVVPMARQSGAEHERLRRREETCRKARQRHPERGSREH